MKRMRISYKLDRVHFDTVKNGQMSRVSDLAFDPFVDFNKEHVRLAEEHECDALEWSSGEVIPFGKGKNKTMIDKILLKFGVGKL